MSRFSKNIITIICFFSFLGCSSAKIKNRAVSNLTSNFSQEILANEARLRLFKSDSSEVNWFFIAGGPGLSSDYFLDLVKSLKVRGNLWLVDFPDRPIAKIQDSQEIFARWQDSLINLAKTYQNPIFVGHSFGGMIVLQTSELEKLLTGLVLFSTSPDSTWPELRETSEMKLAVDLYSRSKTASNYKNLIKFYSPYYFTNPSIGDDFFEQIQYFPHADTISGWFFTQYKYSWVPSPKNSLIITGSKDKIQPISLYDSAPEFNRLRERAILIQNAAHFPWVENLKGTVSAFESFASFLNLVE